MADANIDPTDPSLADSLLLEEPSEISTEDFKQGFGEDLQKTPDLSTWFTGEDLDAVYSRIEAEVREAVAQEQMHRKPTREIIFPRLSSYPGAPKGAGVYQISPTDIKRIHRGCSLMEGWKHVMELAKFMTPFR